MNFNVPLLEGRHPTVSQYHTSPCLRASVVKRGRGGLRRAALPQRLQLPRRRLAARGPGRARGGARLRTVSRSATATASTARRAFTRRRARRACAPSSAAELTLAERRRALPAGRRAAPATATSAACSPPPSCARRRASRWPTGTTSTAAPTGSSASPAVPTARSPRPCGADASTPPSPACSGSSPAASTSTCSATSTPHEERLNRAARRPRRSAARIPLVATNDVRHAARRRPAAARRAHLPAREDDARRRRPPPARATPSAISSRPREMAALFRDLPAGARQHAPHRRALRVHARRPRLPLSRLPAAAGRDADRPPARAHRRGRAPALRHDHAARSAASSSTSSRVIGKLDLAGYFLIVWDIVALLPRARHPRAGPRLGRQLAPSATRSASPPSIRSAWSCCSSASSPRSAASGPTSTSTCRAATSARRSSSTSTSATARAARR